MSQDRPTTYNMLFVCSGNTCRSPLAEAIARRALEERGWSHVQVDSAGTVAMWDAPASEGARQAAAEVDLDLTGHRSQPLTPELVADADIILAMTPGHVRTIEELGGAAKVSLLSSALEGDSSGQPIEDPVGGPPEKYIEARKRISEAVERLLERLEPILSP